MSVNLVPDDLPKNKLNTSYKSPNIKLEKGSVTFKSIESKSGQYNHPNDVCVQNSAQKVFFNMREQKRLTAVSMMFIPPGKKSPEGQEYRRVTTSRVDTFSLLPKGKFYAKWVKSMHDFSERMLELEREENILVRARRAMKDRFQDYLQKIQESKKKA